jgi:hypothetical protein
MKKNTTTLRAAAALAFLLGLSGTALARDGDGLDPWAALEGNDRSGGVDSGNYSDPRYNTYLQAYGTNGPNAPFRPAGGQFRRVHHSHDGEEH